MKKTLKKVLILFALVATVAVLCAFSSSAINCGEGNHNLYPVYHAPTCTEPGYTEYFCSFCDEYREVSGSTEAPLGHDFAGVPYTYEVDGDGYKRGKFCHREDCSKIIYDTHINPETKEAEYDRYYLVQVMNPFATENYYADITYTKVVENYKTELVKTKKNAEYGIWFIKAGDTLESYILNTLNKATYTNWMYEVNNTNIARREKDKAFGRYDLVGWAYEILDADEYTDADIIDFATAVITANTNIYATFKGDETVTYEVQYRGDDYEYFTTDFKVRHGKAAADDIFLPEYDAQGKLIKYNNTILDKEEDLRNYYEFKDWNIDRTEIYGNATLLATYTAIPKEYDFAFYKWDASKNEYVDSGVRARAKYGEALIYVHKDGTKLTEAEIKALTARDKDRSYVYSWDGNWEVLGSGLQMKAGSCAVPYGAVDVRHENEEGYKPVILIPTYVKRQNLYKTTVTIKFDSSVDFNGTTQGYDTEVYLNGLNVQITDANGQLIAKGTANLVAGTDYAQFNCSLYDSKSYTVTVTSVKGKYSGSTTLLRPNVYDFDAPVYISVGLTVDEDYISGLSCKCICHNTLFKPIWVKVLNLLYRLFNVKYVCCDDMYVSLGDLLAYTK